MRLRTTLIALTAALLFAGCKSTPEAELASVFIETGAGGAAPGSTPAVLPVSGIAIPVAPKAVVMAERLAAVSVVMAGDSDLRQHYVMLTLDPGGMQDIALLSRDAMGRSLVLVIGSDTVGIMRITQPIGDGSSSTSSRRGCRTTRRPSPWPHGSRRPSRPSTRPRTRGCEPERFRRLPVAALHGPACG
jgi:hypothetical protein